MDIPVHHFYHAKAVNGPDMESNEIFHYTNMVMDVVDNLFYDDQVAWSPAMYFDIKHLRALLDPITKSRYNLEHVALIMNVIASFAEKGVHPKDQGIIMPYMAQVLVYWYAAHQMNLNDPLGGWDQLLIGTVDSMEGEERMVMHVDTVVTHELGFVDEPGWMLVMMTQAKHANIMYGNTASLHIKKSHHESDLMWVFDMAKATEHCISRMIPSGHPFMRHQYIQDHTQGGPSKEMDNCSHDHDEMPLDDNMAWGEDCAMATDQSCGASQSFGTDQLWD